jgi:hypothetical protein
VSTDGNRPELAPAYQLALDLEAEGLRGPELAERLGVPVESLPSLLSVAHAKADAAGAVTEPDHQEVPDAPHPHDR